MTLRASGLALALLALGSLPLVVACGGEGGGGGGTATPREEVRTRPPFRSSGGAGGGGIQSWSGTRGGAGGGGGGRQLTKADLHGWARERMEAAERERARRPRPTQAEGQALATTIAASADGAEDSCERRWQMMQATAEEVDGEPDLDRDEFLEHCRRVRLSEQLEQCTDPAYRREHADECADQMTRMMQRMQRRGVAEQPPPGTQLPPELRPRPEEGDPMYEDE